jgi:hypothetical protein
MTLDGRQPVMQSVANKSGQIRMGFNGTLCRMQISAIKKIIDFCPG